MEEKNWWIFTFGCGQKYEGYYVRIWGTFESARQKMFDKYGAEWAFQNSIEQWNYWVQNKPSYIPLEIEMEVIP